jgi:predicted outer membrane repeat protein
MRAARVFAPLFFVVAGLAGSGLHAASSNQLVRVPQDAKTLDAAISRVADGGVIELAAGIYPSPPNGFTINNARKGFTVRAAAAATVALDGGGSRNLLRFVNSDRARGKRVTFQRIVFQNGYSADLNESGGLTLSAAEAFFQGCSFLDNRAAATMTGGGAVKALSGSSATFVNCSFRGNTSPLRGGAIAMRASEVTIQGGEFVGNRTNLPGHNPGSFGGGIMVIDGTLSVSGTRFEGNEAGWIGGAIYAIGNWDRGSKVFVTRSTFVGNRAAADSCCVNPVPASGGALHAEDLTTMRVHDSLFVGNEANYGGAVDSYRADVEIDGAVFQRNAADVGAAVSSLSIDFADSSTGNGAINRRSARLVVDRSLFQGGSAVAPQTGACILASGDNNRVYGGDSVAPAGTLAENRARVEIRNSVFSDCDVADDTGGFGGALVGDLLDLDIQDSMFLDSDARGPGAGGGAVALRQESTARIVRTTFAHDSADRWGGALYLNGSTLQMDGCRFFGNDVVPGVSEGLGDSRGAAIYSIPRTDPARPRNVGGVVANSLFADNTGIPVWDVDPQSGPLNEMRYDGNRFGPTPFGDRVYVSTRLAPGGASAATLNTLKSAVPNAQVFGLSDGALVSVPSPNSVGAGAAAPTAAILAYAWTGGSAAVGSLGLSQRAGLLEVSSGSYTLAVDQAAVAAVRATGSCTAGPSLCLAGNRFRAELAWKNGAVATPARAVSISGDTGYFWFVDPANVELVVKVLDGRSLNGSFWVFYGGLTDVAYTLTVTDTATGAVKIYTNPAGKHASAGDTTAFPATGAAAAASRAAVVSAPEPDLAPELAKAACAAGPASLCLNGSRFQVDLTWKDFAGHAGVGQAVPLSGDTGYFWFSSPDNVEVVVKVLDGRALNGQFWVFYGALSDLEYTLRVTDTQTGASKSYHNLPHKFGSVGDTSALPGS